MDTSSRPYTEPDPPGPASVYDLELLGEWFALVARAAFVAEWRVCFAGRSQESVDRISTRSLKAAKPGVLRPYLIAELRR